MTETHYIWTEKEDAVLARCILRGEPYDRIAQRLGRSAQGCSRRAYRLGIAPKNPIQVQANATYREQKAEEHNAKEFRQRDDAFVRRVIREAMACGVLRSAQCRTSL